MTTISKQSKYNKHFRSETGNIVVCVECEKVNVIKKYNMPPGYGTSHLRRHLINHHQIVVDAPNSGPLGDSVADLIITHALPFNFTQSDGFRNVINKSRLYPEEALPSSDATVEIIHQKYLNEVSNLKKKLKKVPFASLILDHWTSSDSKNYVGIVVVFITNKFCIQTKMIDFHMVEEHGAIYTHEMLKNIAKEFRIYSKLSGSVGDSTSSMLNTLELTAKDSNSFKHVCLCHVFQLAINAALDDTDNDPIYRVLQKLKKMVNFVRASAKFIYFATARANDKGIQFLVPKKDNPTRWDSKFLMIESVALQIDELNLALEEFSTKEKKKVTLFDDEEKQVISTLYKKLGMFRNVTIQGQDQDRSIGSLIPIYCYINTCCSLCNESKKSYVRKLAMVIRQEFDLRVNRHYKSNGIWKIEYIVSAFLEQSSKQFIKTLDDYGELENAFRGFVNINTSFNPRVPPNLKFPCKKLPSLSFDQMLRGVNNHLELAVYDEEQHTTAELSELTVYLADHSYQDLKNLAWWNRRKNPLPLFSQICSKVLVYRCKQCCH